MYSNLTLYYLNQMGIKPWIKKTTQQTQIKLLVIIPSNLSLKAQSLLKQILSFINLNSEKTRIISIQESIVLKAYDPLAILLLGCNQSELESNLNIKCPIFFGASLEYLIQHPSEKRKILKELNLINELVRVC